jgi:hypothetical protein
MFAMTRIILLSLLTAMTASADTLEEYRWKNRLIVFAWPVDRDSAPLKMLHTTHGKAIKDRDIRWIEVSEQPTSLDFTHRPAKAKALRKKLKLAPGDFVLIGKDGGVKARQSGELDLLAWFRLIDSMPMRQRDMRESP